ncbi:MAG: DNA-directed RNA polymerase subunit D [Candidatus Thermoplasmatota archaeon]|nr:DNA-directed RNA polymerase subunit D [Candidatus Thermoplasmatota archaeon]
MKVKLRESERYFAQVEFEDVNYSFINSIRRSLVSMVPCLAIHEVDFHMGSLGAYVDEETGEEKEYESISAMFNEIVAHRIGMLPIPTDEKTLEAFADSIGDDSKQPDIMYSLHKQGPCTVYSGDLEPVNGDASLVIPETSVPIVKLAEGQAILVYAKAKIGTAKQHAKWQTVVAPRFYQAPTLTVAPGKGSKTVIKTVGKEHFKKKGKNQVIEDPVVAHKAIKKTESLWNDEDAKNAMTITRNKTHFILEFETTGAMEAKLALQQALKSLDSHCKDFMTCLDSAT